MYRVVTPEVNPDTEPLFVVAIYGDVQVKAEGHPRTGNEGLTLTSTLDSEGVQRHASAALPLGKTR